MKSSQIVLYGHFGVGNLGNDSTLEAMLYNIRKYQPSATVICVCTGPHVIAQRFGIETLPIDVNEDRDLRRWSGDKPNKATRLFARALDEGDFWTKRTLWLRSVAQFMVVGTGALDDMAVARPWSAPYDLFKWCRAAKLAGSRVRFVSIGAGPIVNPVSRLLMLNALRAADYRSYRDVASLDYLQKIGFNTKGDSIYPDLVFSLPEKVNPPTLESTAQPRTVGLGVIGYYGWRHDTNAGGPIFHDYITKLTNFVHWLLSLGYSVKLLTGDLPVDQAPVDVILASLRTEGPNDWQERVTADEITSVDDLLGQIAQTDIVVASRFHNVLCALMMGRPVVSIGYHAKNDALMAEMGLGAYCQHIEHLDVEQLKAQFSDLVENFQSTLDQISEKNVAYRQVLGEQYERLLCT